MKILILGSKGQLGNALIQLFDTLKIPYYGVSHEETSIEIKEAIEHIIERYQPDCVINTVAYHVVDQCEEKPELALLINAVAAAKIASYCNKKQIAFVHISTDYVFDGRKGLSYEEDDIPNPVQWYGVSKYAGEIAIKIANSQAIIIRTCGLYGGREGSRVKKGNFVLSILREAEQKAALEISSEQIVSPTYVNDLAIALIDLLKQKPQGGIYHLINEGYCSWADFAKKIIEESKLTNTIIPVDRSTQQVSVRRPLFSALKNNKAAAIGVILPKWEDAIHRYIQYLSS